MLVYCICHPKTQKWHAKSPQKPQRRGPRAQRAAGENRAPAQTSAGPQGSSTAPQKAGSAKRRLRLYCCIRLRCGHGGRRAHPCRGNENDPILSLRLPFVVFFLHLDLRFDCADSHMHHGGGYSLACGVITGLSLRVWAVPVGLLLLQAAVHDHELDHAYVTHEHDCDLCVAPVGPVGSSDPVTSCGSLGVNVGGAWM